MLNEEIDEKEIIAIEEAMDKEIEAAYQFAQGSPFPDASEVTSDVYSSDNERSVAR